LARWLTHSCSDAEDVVQEAYLRAFKFFRGYHTGDGRAWILKIVRNTSYTWMKKNRRPEIVYELNEDVAEDQSKDSESKLIENAERDLLRRHLRSLPATVREVMVLRHIEGLSYKEIAALIETPIGTVMSRLSRGRNRLQESLTRAALSEPRAVPTG
jgi:RNA polymerase sigma-70 factor (ECF subfamily)